ncbi:MAG: RDD family protein [Kineosporiaceae bacterium]
MAANEGTTVGTPVAAGVVSGEAVVLELRPASFATRGLALAIDLVAIVGLAGALSTFGSFATLLLDEAWQAAAALVASILALVGLPVAMETLTRGRTLGKLALGLRTVRDDGGPVRFRQSLVRGVLVLVEVYSMPYLALISTLANPRGKRLGDLLAGTYVIRDRTDARWTPAPMPPHLASWAAAADVGHLPEPVVAAARTYLDAAPHLQPEAFQELSRRLAVDLARFVQPPPPPGTAPHDVVCAVLAERRRRDLVRLRSRAEADHLRRWRRAGAAVLSPASSRLVSPTPAPPTGLPRS